MRRVVILLLMIFIIDLYMMINLSAAIGLSLLGLWLFLSSCFGIYLIRWQSLRAVKLARQTIVERELPANIIFASMLMFFSGVLLVIPGLITDFLGLVFLMPNVKSVFVVLIRRQLGVWVTSLFNARLTNNSFSSRSPISSEVIEGELAEADDKHG